MSSTSSWPPESLASTNIDDLINECELMELLPERGAGKQFIPVVQMASLLYVGEYVHARHLWRRWKENNPPSLLLDWWKVGAGMMDCDPSMIWQGLEHIQHHHPTPVSRYAVEVGTAYRKRIILQQQQRPGQVMIPPPYLGLLHFSSPEEFQTFCIENKVGPATTNETPRMTHFTPSVTSTTTISGDGHTKATLTQVVAFLESHPGTIRT